MCRGIGTLHDLEPAATEDEVRAAALQRVRTISGSTRPARVSAAALARAVEAVHAASQAPPADLTATAPRRTADARPPRPGRGRDAATPPDPPAGGWPAGAGVLTLPDGATVRGRALRGRAPGGPDPDWALHLLGAPPPPVSWPSRWVRWPDFRLPADPADAWDAFAEAHARALRGERVEVACAGGRGRTGTALACLARLAGVPAGEAVAWVRDRYDPRAVETPWQRRFVRRPRPGGG